MRKRMICPSIWTNRKFIRLSNREKKLFIGLFSTADDYGKLWYDLLSIKASVFPCDNITENEIQIALHKMHQLNLIVTDEKVIKLHGWRSHQSVPKPTISNIPEPLLRHSDNARVTLPNQYSNDRVAVNDADITGSAKEIKKEINKESNFPNDKDLSILNSKEFLRENEELFEDEEYSVILRLIEEGKHLSASGMIYEKLEKQEQKTLLI